MERSSIPKLPIILLALTVFAALSLVLFPNWLPSGPKTDSITPPSSQSLDQTTQHDSFQTGTGVSRNPDPVVAINEALTQALKSGKHEGPPDYMMLIDSNGKDFEVMIEEIRRVIGGQTLLHGSLTGSGVGFSNRGATRADKEKSERSLSLLTVKSDDVQFGVGSSRYDDHDSIGEAAKAALLQAIGIAGKPHDEPPQAVLVSPSFGNEEAALAGLESHLGTSVPILGGTVFRSLSGSMEHDTVIGGGGISLTVIYTDLPIGWVYEAGFDVQTPVSAVVTKLDGRRILELDNRPALEVYDEWFDGKLLPLCLKGDGDAVRRLRNLNPLCKPMVSPQNDTFYHFTIAAPNLEHMAVDARIDIELGDRLFLSQGTWDKLINRLGQLPGKAQLHAGLDRESEILMGIGYFCGGVVDVLPSDELDKIPLLVNRSHRNAPFIAGLSAGEQGHFPGIGNRHGHLSTSFLVIGKHKP